MIGKLVYFVARATRALAYRTLDAMATSYYRIVCARFGKGSRVGWGTWMSYPSNIKIGQGVRIGRGNLFSSEIGKSTLDIEDAVCINDNVKLDFSGNLRIEKSAFISEQVIVYTHSHGQNPHAPPTSYEKNIGRNAWLGVRVMVLHGCTSIGSDAVIGAGTTVTKSIVADVVVVGQSSRVVAGNVKKDAIIESAVYQPNK